QREQGDRALAALVVAVEHLDQDAAAALDELAGGGELGRGRVTQRALPEPDVVGRDVDVAGEPAELGRIEAGLHVAGFAVLEPPAVQDRHPGADVAYRHGQVDRLVGDLGVPAAAG